MCFILLYVFILDETSIDNQITSKKKSIGKAQTGQISWLVHKDTQFKEGIYYIYEDSVSFFLFILRLTKIGKILQKVVEIRYVKFCRINFYFFAPE